MERIALDNSNNLIVPIQEKVNRAMKITLLSPGLTWIIYGVKFNSDRPIKTVHANERTTPEFELTDLVKKLRDSNLTPPLAEFRTREEWIQQQKDCDVKRLWIGIPGIYEAADGLVVFEEHEGEPVKTIVPASIQLELVK